MALVDDIRFADDPKAYKREWVRRKRALSPAYAKQEAKKAREWQRNNPLRNAKNEYRKRTRNKGLDCTLTDAAFEVLMFADCLYCGAAPSPVNGIDRKDRALGYVEGNCVTACRQCNIAKNIYSLAEFEAWIGRVTARGSIWRKEMYDGSVQ